MHEQVNSNREEWDKNNSTEDRQVSWSANKLQEVERGKGIMNYLYILLTKHQ